MPDNKNLAQILLDKGKLSKENFEKIRLESLSSGKAPEKIIEENSYATDDDLVQAKGELYNIPYISLFEKGVAPEALKFIPRQVAERFTIIPFAYEEKENVLSLAMANPLDLETIEFAERKSGCKIKVFIAPKSAIEKSISERYSQNLSAEVTEALKETTLENKTIDIKRLGEVIREAPIAKIVSTILEFAMRSRASDIHIEPEEDKTRVRYRIDGILHEKLILPKNVHEALISRIKILSDLKIDEKRIPQDGRFNFRADDMEVDLRVSTLPTVHGEKVVMRLLKKSGKIPTLPELGLRGQALRNLDDAILRPHGIILVCGPTGSGKTTTLYSVLSKINLVKVNIVTIEDPVEYKIAGVNQVQINPQAGLTFAAGLRAFLRQDPNVVMVGEIRDRETTDLAIQASLTGHLVFSTLHTKSSAQALPRLLDMNAEPFLLASSVTCIMAQRICRRICQECKEEVPPSAEVEADFKNVLGKLYPEGKKPVLAKGKGCETCNGTGYLGRIGIFEVLPVSEKISRLILERAPAIDIEKQACEEGMVTMKQDGYLKVLEQVTTLEEVLRVAQD
ncbi:MAG: Type II secretion system protein E [Microgenomates group bacterium ADurb.Bin219]|nr:MAG: Type II secretion system protein E [Microgenomates group bacterium ADurb.Bin219]